MLAKHLGEALRHPLEARGITLALHSSCFLDEPVFHLRSGVEGDGEEGGDDSPTIGGQRESLLRDIVKVRVKAGDEELLLTVLRSVGGFGGVWVRAAHEKRLPQGSGSVARWCVKWGPHFHFFRGLSPSGH